jgi:fatty acid desaturase
MKKVRKTINSTGTLKRARRWRRIIGAATAIFVVALCGIAAAGFFWATLDEVMSEDLRILLVIVLLLLFMLTAIGAVALDVLTQRIRELERLANRSVRQAPSSLRNLNSR